MATAIDDLPLTAQQRRNRANQLPQSGLNPADGIANLAGDIGAGVQAGAESMQRGIAQQGRAYQTVASYLNNGDPVGDAASGIADFAGQAWDGTKRFFKESADAARTSSYGLDPDPRMTGTPIQAIQQPVQNATAQAANPAMPPQVQPAPAARAPLPVIPGINGGISADITQTSAAASSRPAAPVPTPAGGIAAGLPPAGRTVTTIATPESESARAQANKLIGQSAGLMAGDNGIGGGIVASGMLKKAGQLSAIDTAQRGADTAEQNAGNAARNTDIAAFDAVSKDQDRRTDNAIKQDALDEKKRQNAMREELAALNDANDPGGKKRAALTAKMRALSGKEQDHFQPVIGKDDLGNPIVLGIFNKQTGTVVDPAGKPIKSKQEVDSAHHDAQAAIAKGMDKNEVNRRLLSAGYPAI